MAGPLIAIVGVCAAGKSTLGRKLRELGFNARPILQEHSYVPTMWLRITRPDILVYLAADLDTVRWRRHDPEFPAWLWEQELERLRHAREHAHVRIDTSRLSPEEVLAEALDGLARLGAT
jgi:shikimate kinase